MIMVIIMGMIAVRLQSQEDDLSDIMSNVNDVSKLISEQKPINVCPVHLSWHG